MKEKYYQTNAMYEYIEKNKLPGYTLAKENIWLMVYGDPESIPGCCSSSQPCRRSDMKIWISRPGNAA